MAGKRPSTPGNRGAKAPGRRFEKRIAEDLAEAIPGVRDVHNRLRVDQPRT